MSKATKKPKMKPDKPRAAVCDVVEERPAKCPKCGSTERTPLEGTLERTINGTTRDGRDYTHVKWSYSTCKGEGCGQRYRVVRYENRGGA